MVTGSMSKDNGKTFSTQMKRRLYTVFECMIENVANECLDMSVCVFYVWSNLSQDERTEEFILSFSVSF